MTRRTSFLTRFLALVMALVLIVSNANLGLTLRAFAAEGETITDAQMLINSYGLSDAEAALLNSGYLKRVEYPVAAVSEEDLTVEVSEKTITATSADSKWKPVAAELVVDGQPKETVTLNDGVGTFNYEGDDFAVRVVFAQLIEVPAADQVALLNAGANVNVALATLEAAKAADGDLGTIAQAVPQLVELVDASMAAFGQAPFGENAVAAINELNSQVETNGGELTLVQTNSGADLSDMAQEANRSSHKALVEETAAYLKAIYNDGGLDSEYLADYTALVEMLKGALSSAIVALDKAAAAEWTTMDAVNLTDSVNYADLASKAAGLTKTYDASAKLEADSYTKTWINEVSMKNISVAVVLNVAEGTEIAEYSKFTDIVTVAKDASEEVIAAAVAEVEAAQVATWGDVYVAEHYTRTEELVDNTYTITYTVKSYSVTDADGNVEQLPYGAVLTLPKHGGSTYAYSYKVNDEAYREGAEITITGDTVITRTTGNAFADTDLYTAVANAYGNNVVKAILTSGAVKGNADIYARKPDASLLNLDGNDLTAGTFDAEFEENIWAPYSYTAGGETGYFSGTSTSINPAPKTADVIYRLELKNYNDRVDDILELAVTLKTEAEGQIEAMDRLLAKKANMDQLDSAKIGIIKPLVSGYEYGIEGATDAELQQYFSEAVTELEKCLDKDGTYGTKGELKLFNMLTLYQNEGFVYYYKNYETIKAEVAALSECASGLVGDEIKQAALTKLLGALNMEEYVQFIADLGRVMGEINEDLTDRNAAIDMDSANLKVLMDALQATEAAEYTTPGVAYIETTAMSVVNAGMAKIEIKVFVDGDEVGSVTDALGFGETLTGSLISELQDAAAKIFNDVVLYNKKVEGELKEAIVEGDLSINIFFTAKDFTATIVDEAGETVGTQTFNVNDPYINLEQHAEFPVYTYEYSLDGIQLKIGDYKVEDLKDITVVRKLTEQAKEEIQDAEDILNGGNKSGNTATFDPETKTLTVNLEPSGAGFQDFAMDMMNLGYPYIMLNGDYLLTQDEAGEAVFSLQTIIDAMLADSGFSSERMIALRDASEDNVKLLFASNDASFRKDKYEEYLEDCTFILNVKDTNSQITKVANGLEAIKPYMTFKSAGDYMDIDLNLPQPVYEVYLTAILATNYNELDKTNINDINNEIAYTFLHQYINDVLNSEANATTFQNTIDKLIKEAEELSDKDLPSINVEQYGPYYDLLKKLMTEEDENGKKQIDVSFDDANTNVTVTAKDNNVPTILNFLIDRVGEDYAIFLRMVEEYKENGTVSATAKANLKNVDVNYEAMLIDATKRSTKLETAKKIYDFTADLPARVADMSEGVVVLLDNIEGNLNFSDTTILDLNGKTINGNINSKGTLIIVDSSLDTVGGGTVNGTVSGNVIILSGNYSGDVTAFLKDGYVQKNGSVQNAVYTIQDGNIKVNTNFMFSDEIDGYLPAVQYLAVDLAIDLAMNYYSAAALSANGNNIYNLAIDDIVAILGTDSNSGKVAALVDDVLAAFRFEDHDAKGIDDFINEVVADLLDLEAISASIKNGTPVASYSFVTNPWSVDVKHVADVDDDYLTVGIVPNTASSKTYNFSLTFDIEDNGDKTDKILAVIDEMARIITDETYLTIDIDQPVRDGKTLVVSGGAKGYLSLDFSHNERYLRLLAVLLSYGDPEAFEGLIEDGNVKDLEAAIDQTTAGEVFNSLKTVAEKVFNKADAKLNFEEIANKVDVKLAEKLTDEEMTKMEELYETFMNGVNKILAKIDASSYADIPMSQFKNEDGTYSIEGDIKINTGEAYYRGYGVKATIEGVYAGVKIKLYPDCMWGDANHDGKVNAKDATLIARYGIGLPIDGYFCTLRTDVNGDRKIDDNGNIYEEGINAKDATLVLRRGIELIDKFPVEE